MKPLVPGRTIKAKPTRAAQGQGNGVEGKQNVFRPAARFMDEIGEGQPNGSSEDSPCSPRGQARGRGFTVQLPDEKAESSCQGEPPLDEEALPQHKSKEARAETTPALPREAAAKAMFGSGAPWVSSSPPSTLLPQRVAALFLHLLGLHPVHILCPGVVGSREELRHIAGISNPRRMGRTNPFAKETLPFGRGCSSARAYRRLGLDRPSPGAYGVWGGDRSLLRESRYLWRRRGRRCTGPGRRSCHGLSSGDLARALTNLSNSVVFSIVSVPDFWRGGEVVYSLSSVVEVASVGIGGGDDNGVPDPCGGIEIRTKLAVFGRRGDPAIP